MVAAAATGAAPPAENVCLAGTDSPGWCGDGGPATRAHLGFPQVVVPTAGGGMLIADTSNNVVRRVSPGGVVTAVAGNGRPGFSGDGGAATAARLRQPSSVAPLSGGGFLIADLANNRIRRVSPSGTITTVAGSGEVGYSGDGGRATNARLSQPSGVATRSDGSFLVADTGNSVVRKVSPNGTIATVAGTGESGYSGDGGPATAATLSSPRDIAPTAGGGFLIADTGNNVIRRVSPFGAIETVAGDGMLGDTPGDGRPATEAELAEPTGVAARPDGSFLIAARYNFQIFLVSVDGRITSVAGTPGLCHLAGDGGPATSAGLALPQGVAVTSNGGFLIADTENSRIRRVSPDGTIKTVAGTGPSGFCGASPDYDPQWNVFYITRRPLQGHAGRRYTVYFRTSLRKAKVTAEVLRAGQAVASVSGLVPAGDRTLRFAKTLPSGSYAVRITGRAPSGHTKKDQAPLTIAP